MERPKFEPIFTKKSDYCEKSASKPVETFIPHQAISLKELVSRFERGQRLNVHMNFRAGDNFENITDEEALMRMKTESMDTDDFPPVGVHDISEVEEAYKEHQNHKVDFAARQKKKQEDKQAQQQKQAQQSSDPNNPTSPSAKKTDSPSA